MLWIRILILPLALLADRLIGDPRSALHPVALVGRFIGWWGSPALMPPAFQRLFGMLMWVLTVILFALPFYCLEQFLPWYIFLVGGPILLNFCFAWRSLEEHTGSVVQSLQKNLPEGRRQVSLLVSRSTSDLDPGQVLSAAYESLCENLVDSIIAPLFYYSLFGLAGAAVYRAANTMDAMLGYRDERIRLGWFSARADDILNYIPARIAGVILLIYFAWKGRFAMACQTLQIDGHKRPGINGGIPIAIIAGGTGVMFEKPGVYRIGPGVVPLEEAGNEIMAAVRAVTLIFSLLMVAALLLLGSLAKYIGI
ncbi:MAG: cobalamin biosynthesis protein CobD [Methanolinea sp. SDB]|nr:MAG: cobalamin biosynthesis protein CobD [Methanolinea sp. SDB]